ncbi:MAG: non-ribosomal peptide synthetase, partial [bacterium]|nr:non-ribosomal peptide synthetase [bacterium]
IRGVRIEPAEIEACLARRRDISQAVVSVSRPEDGITQLVAYVVPGERKPDEAELQSWLADRLLPSMQPAHIVFMSAFPLTSNQKVDFSALPPPLERPAAPDRRAPETELERLLLSIFEEVLGKPVASVHDNFLALGGDSLKAQQVVNRLSQRTRADWPVGLLFRHSSVAKMAAEMSRL